MGYFSEMSIDMAAGVEPERNVDNTIAFAADSVKAGPPPDESTAVVFDDEAAQQAEADAAPAVLASLNEPSGNDSDADDEPGDDESCSDPCEDDSDESEQTAEEKPAAPVKKDDDPVEKMRKFEASEAKRKAEWEAKRQEKAEEEYVAWEEILAKTDGDAETAAVKKIGADAERLTRRNMKVCVAEHIQTKCLDDAAFARQAMHPRKSFINCLRYINRHARAFIEQEMKDNDEKMSGMAGGDVPDDLCYKWAEDYFLDMNAEEDMGKDEKFVPKSAPYISAADKKKVAAAKKEAEKQAAAEKKAVSVKPEKNQVDGQMTLGEAC